MFAVIAERAIALILMLKNRIKNPDPFKNRVQNLYYEKNFILPVCVYCNSSVCIWAMSGRIYASSNKLGQARLLF